MATLQIRNMPDDLMEKLRELAKREHRSVSAQALVELEKIVTKDSPRQIDTGEAERLIERARRLRETLRWPENGPTIEEVIEQGRRERDERLL